jgi:hypothetical protein
MTKAMMMVLKRRIEDESGIALPLAVIMVVLVGVMGAGLLTFVVTDLNAVVEVNQGQKALEMAEAGVKVAKMELMEKPFPANYTTSSDWHPDYGGAGRGGRTITMDGNQARVTIREAPGSISTQPLFEVTSDSTVGQARRKVHALFKAAGWGMKAYYTPGSIYIGPDNSSGESISGKLFDRVDIRGVSLFAGQDVIIEDNFSVTYRQIGTTTTATDTVTGGGYRGLTSGPGRYCIYQDDPTPGFTDYKSRYDSFGSCTTLFGSESDYRSRALRYPSAWETASFLSPQDVNLPQPHIRIVANAECTELYDQWVNPTGGKPFAVDPDFHEDALGDWAVAPFNTVARAADPTQSSTPCQDGNDMDLEPYPTINATTGAATKRYIPAGIAAEGKICRGSEADPTTRRCSSGATSIAGLKVGDIRGGAGRIGYDGSTLSSGVGFYDKYDAGLASAADDAPVGYANDISYPFDTRQEPDVPGLLSIAQNQPSTDLSGNVVRASRYVNLDTEPTLLNTSAGWNTLYPADNRNPETVVFIDANGSDLELPNDNNPKRGILVVRCGNLTNMDNFKGIILLLTDAGPGDSPSTCATKGNYRTGKPGMSSGATIDIDGYVYAEGIGDPSSADGNDTDTLPDYRFGIFIADGSNVDRLGKNFLGLQSIVGSGVQGVELESWRECYNQTCS